MRLDCSYVASRGFCPDRGSREAVLPSVTSVFAWRRHKASPPGALIRMTGMAILSPPPFSAGVSSRPGDCYLNCIVLAYPLEVPPHGVHVALVWQRPHIMGFVLVQWGPGRAIVPISTCSMGTSADARLSFVRTYPEPFTLWRRHCATTRGLLDPPHPSTYVVLFIFSLLFFRALPLASCLRSSTICLPAIGAFALVLVESFPILLIQSKSVMEGMRETEVIVKTILYLANI